MGTRRVEKATCFRAPVRRMVRGDGFASEISLHGAALSGVVAAAGSYGELGPHVR
jgi:hypothetical protein